MSVQKLFVLTHPVNMSKTPSSVDTYVETLKDELVEVQPTVDALTEKRLDYAQGPVTPFQWYVD